MAKRRISRAEEHLPVVRVDAGEITRAVDEAFAALQARPSDIYQRGGLIVHPVLTPLAAADGRETSSHRVIVADDAYFGEGVTRAATVEKFDGRKNAYVKAHCPSLLVQTMRGRGQFPLRVLNRVIAAPTLRPDGSILESPGYDSATGLLYDPGGREFPAVPDRPTRAEAGAALEMFTQAHKTFPFAAAVDLAVAVAAILTGLVRPSLPSAPLFAYTAPVAGSGKTMLVDGASMIVTGRLAAVISQGENEAEFEKRLGACLLAGDAVICIDNCERAIGGERLCQALTQAAMNVRVLGESINVEVPCSAAIFATGNNLILSGDVTRRAMLCSLDPGCERPELRDFEVNFVELLRSRRAEFVIAGLTILRAHAVAKAPRALTPLGSFVEWSRMVRDALVWLGWPDVCETMAKARDGDPRLTVLTAIIEQWEQVIGDGKRKSVADLIKLAGDRDDIRSDRPFIWPNFRDALLVAAGSHSGALDARRLGKWLSFVEGRIVGGRRLVKAGTHAGVVLWRLEMIEREP